MDFNFYLDEQAISDSKVDISWRKIKSVPKKQRFAYVVTQQEYKIDNCHRMFARQILKTYYRDEVVM